MKQTDLVAGKKYLRFRDGYYKLGILENLDLKNGWGCFVQDSPTGPEALLLSDLKGFIEYPECAESEVVTWSQLGNPTTEGTHNGFHVHGGHLSDAAPFIARGEEPRFTHRIARMGGLCLDEIQNETVPVSERETSPLLAEFYKFIKETELGACVVHSISPKYDTQEFSRLYKDRDIIRPETKSGITRFYRLIFQCELRQEELLQLLKDTGYYLSDEKLFHGVTILDKKNFNPKIPVGNVEEYQKEVEKRWEISRRCDDYPLYPSLPESSGYIL